MLYTRLHHSAEATLHRARPQIHAFGSRHPDYLHSSKDPTKSAVVKDRPDVEADIRYRRVDNSAELAAEARYAFAAGLAAGEAGLQLARQAMLIAAEDDAIASSSVVRFPVEAYMGRIQRLAEDTAAAIAAAAAAAAGTQEPSASHSNQQWASIRRLQPEQAMAAIQQALFQQQQQHQHQQPQQQQGQQQHLQVDWIRSLRSAGYRVPQYGRSNLPQQALVDHPGVWEDARMAYLHEVLVRRKGSPAALVILYSEVCRQLLLMGAMDFAVTFEYGDFDTLPLAKPLTNLNLQQLVLQPTVDNSSSQRVVSGSSSGTGTGSYLSRPTSQLLNTCSSEALCELLRHLKRAYWPFPWDTNVDSFSRGGRGSTGGFRAAAKAALGSDEMSAALRAVSATAAHRLQRGIWTSPGAGDLRRCVAAAERLVMMVGDEQPQERRDLAVLLLHAGRPHAAAAELSAYLDSTTSLRSARIAADPFDVRLANDLWKLLTESGVKAAGGLMSVQAVLSRDGDSGAIRAADGPRAVYQPLVW